MVDPIFASLVSISNEANTFWIQHLIYGPVKNTFLDWNHPDDMQNRFLVPCKVSWQEKAGNERFVNLDMDSLVKNS